ncbi:MAG: transcription elongation factor GreA [Clostridia bacterium]
MAKDFLLTKEGYENLVKELDYYKTVKRREASEHIKAAREYGDLSENAEYDAAKEAQALIEADIKRMELQLDNAVIIEESATNSHRVIVGKKVKILDIEMNEELTYSIVGHSEASILDGSISNDSPLAQAIIGKKVGETVTVHMPDFNYDVKILEIGK